MKSSLNVVTDDATITLYEVTHIVEKACVISRAWCDTCGATLEMERDPLSRPCITHLCPSGRVPLIRVDFA